MNYEISGSVMQTISIDLHPGETIFSQTHAMAWMSDGVSMNTNTGGGLFAGGGNRPQDRGGERRAGVVEETHGWTGRDGGCLRRAPESKGTTNLGHAFAPCGPAASPRKPACAAPRVADPEAGAS